MNIADYVLIAIILISAIVGALRGFLREAVSVVSWLLALFLAWHFSGALEPHLGTLLAQYPQARTWVARSIIVLVVLLVGALVGGLLGQFCTAVHLQRHGPVSRCLFWHGARPCGDRCASHLGPDVAAG